MPDFNPKLEARQILKHPHPDEKLRSVVWMRSFPVRPVITAIMRERHPDGFKMTTRSNVEWGCIAACVNVGIDSHLEAFTESKFDDGLVWIHPDEMGILIDRMLAEITRRENAGEHGDHEPIECPGDGCPVGMCENLLNDILDSLVRKGG